MSKKKETDINLNSYSKNSLHPQKRKHKKKFRRWWKRASSPKRLLAVLGIFLASILSAAIVAGCTWGVVSGIRIFNALRTVERDDDFNQLTSSDLNAAPQIDNGIMNIALFGVDSRKVGNFDGLSDSIMILSVDRNTNQLKLTSIMRDSLVPITHNKKTYYTKINTAYQLGGPALAVSTLNTVFGLDISEYATVNFYGMRDIIDAVGGIEATITKDEISRYNAYSINAVLNEMCQYTKEKPSKYYINKTGKQHLNGLQAVAYARVRHGLNWNGRNDDFGRTERQRYVMQQLLDKALASNLTKYPELVEKLAPYVKTSLSNSQLLDLAKMLANKPPLVDLRIPGDDYIINADYRATGASTVYYNYQFAGKVLHAFIYDNLSEDDFLSQNKVDLTPWYKGGGTVNRPITDTSSGSSEDTDPDNSSSGSSDVSDTSSGDTSSGGTDSDNSSSGNSSSVDTSSGGSSSGDTGSDNTSSGDVSSDDVPSGGTGLPDTSTG